jgi:hypothetical protein
VHDVVPADAVGQLTTFRQEFHRCLSRRPDALFELVDALLCGDGPVVSLPELSLAEQHRRGHGSLYAALSRGRIDIDKLRTVLASVTVPRAADGRTVLAVDVTCWLRPEAQTEPTPPKRSSGRKRSVVTDTLGLRLVAASVTENRAGILALDQLKAAYYFVRYPRRRSVRR